MSSFEIAGTVTKTEKLTSKTGNPYIVFQVKDDAAKIFELSLFGDSMGMASKVQVNNGVIIKGILSSREFSDKNGKTRYGTELKPQWIEVPGQTATGKKGSEVAVSSVDFDSIPF